MAQILTQANFQKEVFESDKPVLVDFFATWCGPCKMMAPIVDELAKELDGEAKVFKVDIDQEEALATKFGIMSIPTFMVVKNGKITAQEPGGRSKEDLKAMLAL
ncbi:thioredoxin [Treponema brennaborense]|uniref:Thioredoxin n=1 Tax=Treponema brennaborense (strain DSM 12168 / CIP 105900 / DD5/3) TaxID=906968 RepID=F4LKL4_TREBD|nr:thioredoxin [Treponema brennaborense]AEE17570.1 thioredoxin [Treponema brennaborense DSM 12168]